MNRIATLLFIAIGAASWSGMGLAQTTASSNHAETSDELFQIFGGQGGIGKIVDDFLAIWQADARISKRLTDADVEHLRLMLKEQIAYLTGGPVKYTGKDMKTIHDGLDIRNAEFNALAEDLQLAMEKNGISSRAQNRLLSKLAPMQHDIVTR